MNITKCTCKHRSQYICDGCFIANKLKNFMAYAVLPVLTVASIAGLIILGGM